ncbi:hypothetical protein FisN_9Lh043 [Fistulifera solaris]|uniref:Uncharacterized protein n=1 Tax=Fistulifera solaris TaxID=1519565 RepID=A0A1Z5KLF8_FISSO|nr:hypothetical protein FisN_9Lh043 [Fistulifera solaris]|eukprot:GAX26778.1 hypothetical protein FisN_9Lh043 [Fistulifera solaris]
MKRERQIDGSDLEGEEENGSGIGQVLSFLHDSGEPLLPFSHHYNEHGSQPALFPVNVHPHSHQNQSTAITSFASATSPQWPQNQTLGAQRKQDSSGAFQNFPASSVARRDTQSAFLENDAKKGRYELLQPRELATMNQVGAQDDGYRSLNLLIDRFIESAEKGPVAQQHDQSSLDHANTPLQAGLQMTLPDALGRGLSGASSISYYGGRSSNAIQPGYYQTVNLDNTIHHPPPALYTFPHATTQGTAVPPISAHTADQRILAPPRRKLSNQVTSSSATSSSSSMYSSRSLFLPEDADHLSLYQCVLRKQIEFFAADWEDVAVIQGRNKPVIRRQVGIRCIHCSHLPIKSRDKGSSYFSARLDALYQSAQNLAKKHLLQKCRQIPYNVREQLAQLKNVVPRSTKGGSTNSQTSGSGKGYWAEAAQKVGVFEDETNGRLEFRF